MVDGELLYEVKPIFIKSSSILISLMLGMFFFPILCMGVISIFAIISNIALLLTFESFRIVSDMMFIIKFFLILIIPFIPYLIYRHMKKSNEETVYRIYKDKVEAIDSALIKSRKLVKISNIKMVSFREGMFERDYGLGTIVLITDGGRLELKNIKNYKDVYKDVVELLEVN